MAVDERLRILAERLSPGSQITESHRLTGGVSAEVIAFELRLPDGTTQKLVLRQYGEADVATNPNVAEAEYQLLRLLQEHGIPVPWPHYYDSTCTLFPAPTLAIDFVDGAPDFEPAHLDDYLEQLAIQLLAIHRAGRTMSDLSFLPSRELPDLGRLRARLPEVDDTLNEAEVERSFAIAVVPTSNPPTLLHGDYWPGNVHWEHEQIVAVIDWEDARVGDPLADVANCRLELLWALGHDAMERFTERYLAAASIDFAPLPYWDVAVAVGPAANYASWSEDLELTNRRRQRLSGFIGQALRQLPTE